MKVRELMAQLINEDPDDEVCVETDPSGCAGITSIEGIKNCWSLTGVVQIVTDKELVEK